MSIKPSKLNWFSYFIFNFQLFFAINLVSFLFSMSSLMNPSHSLTVLRRTTLLQQNTTSRLFLCRYYATNDYAQANDSSSSKKSTPNPNTIRTQVIKKNPSKLSQALLKRPWAARTVQSVGRLLRYDDLRLGAIKASGLHFEVCADQWVNDKFWISGL